MDADISKSCEMDNLVVAYFGQDCDIFDADLNDFWPDRWDMTVEQWIGIVKERVMDNLHTNEHSIELTHF